MTRASIVIPVLDEAGAVARLLTSLREAAPHDFAVIVVCNGCTDNSAEVARSFPDVIVDELTERSKTKALNRGDELADGHYPRFYMDADIEVDVASLLAIVDALAIDQPAAAGPSTRFLVAGKPWSVRSYYFTMDRLPSHQAWQQSHLSGRGVYATNRAGRERFGAFPELRNDDAFFDILFGDGERHVVEAATVGIDVPSSAGELIRNYTRVEDGNRELRDWLSANRPDLRFWSAGQDAPLRVRIPRYVRHLQLPELVRAFRGSKPAAMLVTYLAIRVAARTRCTWRNLRGNEIRWR